MQTFNEYVNLKQKTNIEFCEDRKKGARKIANEASAKGGVARLTMWHFEAKIPEYDQCIKAIKDNKPPSYFQNQAVKLIRQLPGIRNQRKFQEVMGMAEVWGEVFLQVS